MIVILLTFSNVIVITLLELLDNDNIIKCFFQNDYMNRLKNTNV